MIAKKRIAGMKVWQCSVCKYIHKGDKPPEKCPICGVGAKKFVKIDEASIPGKRPKRKGAVTKLKTKIPTPAIKETGFEKIKSLLVKHHAHPVSVHTPNGILPAAVIFFLAAWMFDYDLLAKVAFINMIFVIIALPFVIFTGTLEWKKKYNGALTILFKLKILTASLTAVLCVTSIAWYLVDPKILLSPNAWIFILINVLMLVCAGIAGHIGGKLVFKD